MLGQHLKDSRTRGAAQAWDCSEGQETLPTTSTDGEAAPGAACPGGTSRTSPNGEQEKRSLPSHQLLTHHVEDALMVGQNDSRALYLEVLQSLHLKPQAEEILEGLDNSFDDSAEGKKSSQQQSREAKGCNTQWGWKETRRALGQRTSSLICAVVCPGVCPARSHMLQECCSLALFSAMVLGCLVLPGSSSCKQQGPTSCQTILPGAATPQHTRHPRKALPGLLLAVLGDGAQ